MPSEWTLQSRTLTVRAAGGALLWRHIFEIEPFPAWESPSPSQRPHFADLDGDGVPELLFRLTTSAANDQPFSGTLYCFEGDGRVRWRYQARKTARSGRQEEFPPPYLIPAFQMVRLAGGRRGALLAAAQSPWYAGRAVLHSAEGRELAEYWHSGHLDSARAADRNGDGRDEIHLAGVSNSYRRATLVVLDPASMRGASREENPDYQQQGFPPPNEIARLLFDRSEFTRLSLDPYNYATRVMLLDGRLNVHVQELTRRAPA